METKILPEYRCEKCDYITFDISNWKKHIKTKKHNGNILETKKVLYAEICFGCNRKFKTRSGLWKHEQKCQFITVNNIDNSLNDVEKKDDYKNIIMKLLNENNDLKNSLLKENEELRNQISHLIPRVGDTNNIKQKFNINIFLNEQCKDAISMDQFIDKIEVSMKNLLTTRDKGLAEGIGNLLIENMNKLSVYERPLHCTDKKRETLYIKDKDIWEKDEDKSKIKRAIKQISNKQFKTLKNWVQDNPDLDYDDDKKDNFIQILKNVSCDPSNVDDKIIKNICYKSYLDKSNELK